MTSELIHYYSACIGIRTESTSILCDPWFTEGAFGGSWFHCPWKAMDPEGVGKYDYIYVSHIHPDHYDPLWIKWYLDVFPETTVVIAKWHKNVVPLEAKMHRDGIHFESIDKLGVGGTHLTIIPHDTGSISDIDSCLLVETDNFCVLNMNDCIWDPRFYSSVDTIAKKYRAGNKNVIGLFSFTSAGPYPHTYYWNDAKLESKADQHQSRYLDLYLNKIREINCSVNIPFAGQYVLGGGLEKYNKYRGICDAADVYNIDSKALVLQDYGEGILDLDTLSVQGKRHTPYDDAIYTERLNYISNKPLTYSTFTPQQIGNDYVLRKLMKHAFGNAVKRLSHNIDYCYLFFVDNSFLCSVDLLNKIVTFDQPSSSRKISHSIEIDRELLLCLLLGLEHWDNAEKGSMYRSKRIPDLFMRPAQSFLHFLTI